MLYTKQGRSKEVSYYAITAKLGHFGSGRCGDTTFYIVANSILEATRKIRKFPMVKHSGVDTIISAVQITQEDYQKGRETSAYAKFQNRIK